MFELFRLFNFWSVVDILLLAFIIYHALKLLKGTRAAQMLIGVLIISGAFALSNWLPLITLRWVMSKFYSSFLIILIILFQDDIRHVLRRMGRGSFMISNEMAVSRGLYDQIVQTAMHLGKARIGALIVLERSILLSRYIDGGVTIDAQVSSELLHSIFVTQSPIHDGAVIVQGGRIAAAGCFLPLAREANLSALMGTRHRAALGISEETDAVVIVVSEEQGEVSLAIEGQLVTDLSEEDLKTRIRSLMQTKPIKNQEVASEDRVG